jgi:hypothetical protein
MVFLIFCTFYFLLLLYFVYIIIIMSGLTIECFMCFQDLFANLVQNAEP